MLLRNENEQEVISREKKDRRDFGHLSALATRMGLHWYIKLVLHIVFAYTIMNAIKFFIVFLPFNFYNLNPKFDAVVNLIK